jgi:hypothetical protein
MTQKELYHMMIVTKAMREQIPPINNSESGKGDNLVFIAKLFTPWTNWTWYIAECDWDTGECFGLVEGFERELGYFSLYELLELRGPIGLKVERDRHFKPMTYGDLKKSLR